MQDEGEGSTPSGRAPPPAVLALRRPPPVSARGTALDVRLRADGRPPQPMVFSPRGGLVVLQAAAPRGGGNGGLAALSAPKVGG
jgi:hypothetical protein